MRCASPSTIAVLPTPGSPMSTGIVLRAAREHLHDAADLLVAADDRIELALPRRVGEVARVALQRLVLVLGSLVGDAVRAAHRLERLEQRLVRDARVASSSVAALGALRVGEREQQVLGRDVLVAERPAPPSRPGRAPALSSRDSVRLRVALLRVARDLALHLLAQRGDARRRASGARARRCSPPVRAGRGADACRRRAGCRVRRASAMRLVERLAGLHGQPIGIDHRMRLSFRLLREGSVTQRYESRATAVPHSVRRTGSRGCRCGAELAPACRCGASVGDARRTERRSAQDHGLSASSSDAAWIDYFGDVHLLRETARRRRRARRCRCRRPPRVPCCAPCRPRTDVVAARQLDVVQRLVRPLHEREWRRAAPARCRCGRIRRARPPPLVAAMPKGNVGLRIGGIRIVLSERPCLTPSGLLCQAGADCPAADSGARTKGRARAQVLPSGGTCLLRLTRQDPGAAPVTGEWVNCRDARLRLQTRMSRNRHDLRLIPLPVSCPAVACRARYESCNPHGRNTLGRGSETSREPEELPQLGGPVVRVRPPFPRAAASTSCVTLSGE